MNVFQYLRGVTMSKFNRWLVVVMIKYFSVVQKYL